MADIILPYAPRREDEAGHMIVQTNLDDLIRQLNDLLSGASLTGDYKISAITITHDDPLGGTWYLCDGTAFPGGEADLIAMVGANAPDAQGRGLWMIGTHADVNNLGDNEGSGGVVNRTPSHHHDEQAPGPNGSQFGIGGGPLVGSQTVPTTGGGALNKPSYIAVGNLFIHS